MEGAKSTDFLGAGDAPANYFLQKNKSKGEILTVYRWSSSANGLETKSRSCLKSCEPCSKTIKANQDYYGGIKEASWFSDESVTSHGSQDEDDEIIQPKIEQSTLEDLQNQEKSTHNKKEEILEQGQFKVDDTFLNFVQFFTAYCDKRTQLVLDSSTFFDESCFPHNMILTEYVPMNIFAPKLKLVEIQVPAFNEYCNNGWCANTLYEYFEDSDSFRNREGILRSQVAFLLNSIQCSNLESFILDSTSGEKNADDKLEMDRMLEWNDCFMGFISRHKSCLKSIQIKAIRTKRLSSKPSGSNLGSRIVKPIKTSFPKLDQLTIMLWDSDKSKGEKDDKSTSEEEWTPDWFPDAVDKYWISLMKSQVHGTLAKFCWISAAKLNWNQIFQPIIDANQNSLQALHIIETSTNDKESEKNEDRTANKFMISSSSFILSCAALKNLHKLKELSLRKTNCFLVDLQYLPRTIEKLSIDNIKIESFELLQLKKMESLTILRLADNLPQQDSIPYGLPKKVSGFGVSLEVLKTFLSIRTLNELSVWGHTLNLKERCTEPGMLQNVFGKVNSYLKATIFKSSEVTPMREENSRKSLASCTRELFNNKLFLRALNRIAYVDNECIVINERHK